MQRATVIALLVAACFAAALILALRRRYEPCSTLECSILRLAATARRPRWLRNPIVIEQPDIVPPVEEYRGPVYRDHFVQLPDWVAASLAAVCADETFPGRTRNEALLALQLMRSPLAAPFLAEILRTGSPIDASDLSSHSILTVPDPLQTDSEKDDRSHESRERYLALLRLEALGEAAVPAVQTVVTALQQGDLRSRVIAARTLGHIGKREAVPALLDALRSANWRIQLAAVDALAEIGPEASDALGLLQASASDHWLPTVRLASARATAAIRAGHVLIELHKVAFPLPRCTEHPPDWSQIRPSDGRSENEPGTRLEVDDGALVIQPGGFEWAPRLLHVDKAGKGDTLLTGEIDAIHRTSAGVIALISDGGPAIQGDAWLITRRKDGKWGASQWVHLIGRAVESAVDASGSLWVNTEFGAMRIGVDGSLRYGGCIENLHAALEKVALPR